MNNSPERQSNTDEQQLGNMFGRMIVGVLGFVAAASLFQSGGDVAGEITAGDVPDVGELVAVGGSAVALVALGAAYYVLHNRAHRSAS